MQKYGCSVVMVAMALLLSVSASADDRQHQPCPTALDSDAMPATQDEGAPTIIPGSASPGLDMQAPPELDAGPEPSHGGARDATGGYDAAGPAQMDDDANASVGSTSGSTSDYVSPRHERNLRQAIESKNAHHGGDAGATTREAPAAGKDTGSTAD